MKHAVQVAIALVGMRFLFAIDYAFIQSRPELLPAFFCAIWCCGCWLGQSIGNFLVWLTGEEP